MGYAMVFSPCHICRKQFGCHPHKVPSIRDANNVRQPVCRSCMEAGNELRKQKGLDPFPILPGAYEPCEETEL